MIPWMKTRDCITSTAVLVVLMTLMLSPLTSLAQDPNNEKNITEQTLSIIPVEHTATWAIEWWLPRHEAKLNEIKQRNHDIDLVFLGDSITHNWESKGAQFWSKYYSHRKALNLGFGGDRTEHVLWRLQNGELDGLNPKLVVLMIGTNNTGHRQDPAEATALGIETILAELKQRLPHSKILLLAIFPRGAQHDDPLRQLNDEINAKIRYFADNKNIFWLNMNHVFLQEDLSLSTEVMEDLLHPESPQYEIWAQTIEPYIARFVDTPRYTQ